MGNETHIEPSNALVNTFALPGFCEAREREPKRLSWDANPTHTQHSRYEHAMVLLFNRCESLGRAVTLATRAITRSIRLP